MSDRHHYDAQGNYLGRTSTTPPDDAGGCIGLIVVAIIIMWFIGGC